MSARKHSTAYSKKISTKKITKLEPAKPSLIKKTIKWEDAFPCHEETYKVDKETVSIIKYYPSSSPEFESFLYEVIRSNTLPVFIKTNFKKLRKFIEKEIIHRDKLYEKLSKEQVIAFQSYFQDESYFERDNTNEYFHHELERVYYNYLKTYLDTGLYGSRVRSHSRKRRQALEKHGIKDG